jgi:predicted RNase H-like HicB family nuclease
METYLVVIGRTSSGYGAHCPDVLGCAAVGKTVEKIVGSRGGGIPLESGQGN